MRGPPATLHRHWVAILFGCGCAAATPNPAPIVAPAVAAADAGLVSPEMLDEITLFFKRKLSVVAHCYADAVAAGRLDKAAKGRITLGMSIDEHGKPTRVRVAESTLNSAVVETCVVGLVSAWQLSPPGAVVEFSYSYDFERL